MFEKLRLNSSVLDAIKRLGHTQPTKIQEESIPHIMAGKDVIGESATGSGKTLAFGTGIMQKVVQGQGIQGLVLTPTRELAEQVKNSLQTLARQLKVVTVYGGVSINPQIDALPRADVVVATPGRLLDHLDRRTVNLSKVKILVLDEADRMLDMGFIDDVEQIIKACPKQRQTLFFSATIAQEIRELAKKYMHSPVLVSTARHVDPAKLKQIYYDVTHNLKLSLLAHLLQNEKSGLVMVFCNTRKTTDFVVKNLKANKISAIAIHGGLSQNKRTNTIEMFNDEKVNVLVCTDVAARGLHIENVSHVYNYDLPKDPKDYVHRIGRTARAGEEGKVINLLSNPDHGNFYRILDEYRNFNIVKTEKPQLTAMITVRSESPREGSFGRGNSFGQRRSFGPRRSRFGERGNSGQRRSSGGQRQSFGQRSSSRFNGPRRSFRRR